MKTTKQAFSQLLLAGCLLFMSSAVIAQQTPQLSDPEIASAAVTANQIDIEFAQIALKQSKNAEVLNFAKTMANDHKGVIDKAVALVTKLKVTPKTNDLTKKLLEDASKTKQKLQSHKGASFDKAYVDNEVAYHKAVIGSVETILVPKAKKEELKSLLETVVPVLKTNLAHAEMVQKMIQK